MLEFQQISRSFGPVVALENVSLALSPGKVYGILGENGAGKTTLMNIAAGLLRPSHGRILINGEPLALGSPRAAQGAGIGMVHQHFRLAPRLTVLENVALAVGRRRPRDHRASAEPLRQRLLQYAREASWPMDPDVRVERLSIGQQQRVEIIKAILTGGRFLILDEPTAVLTPEEAAQLLATLKTLVARQVAVIFISHKLNEIKTVCDYVAVLRRGRLVYDGPAHALTTAELAEKMVAARVELPRLTAEERQALPADLPAAAPPALQLAAVTVRRPGGQILLNNVSLAVAPGEILGIAGVDGIGQAPLAQAITGETSISSGAVLFSGQPVNRWNVRRRRRVLAYIPEDRQRQALVLPLSIIDNLALNNYRDPALSWRGWRMKRAWRTQAQRQISLFDVRCNAPTDAAASLSGGNQQKVVVARELFGAPAIILAVNPTRGLDIGATAFVLRQLLAARQRGAAILLIHNDLDELLSVSNRVMVLYNGNLVPSPREADGAAIGRLMLGL